LTFSGCTALQSISIPNGVTDIEDSFWGCKNLSCISIPNSVTYIGNNTFMECCSLKEIRIPIGRKDKFEKLLPYDKDKLVEQEERLSTNVCSTDFLNAWIDDFGVKYSPDRKRLIRSSKNLKEYSIIDGTTVICDVAFSEVIRRSANSNYIGLTTITIPNSVITIGEYVFSGCQNLVSIYIPIGTKKRFEELLPEYKNKLVEQEMGWIVKNTRLFDPEEIAAVDRAEVVAYLYGNSVCFFMNGGGQTYIPLSKQSKLAVGDELDLKTAKLVTLCRMGYADITRVIE
jgi:hypothetical protein